MDTVEEHEITTRIIDLIEHQTTDMSEHDYQNPVDRYTNPERYAAEVDRLYMSMPLAVGHISEIPQPGDFKTLHIGTVPILVTRDRDGSVRAFKNVCSHRGTLLVEEQRGSRRAFSCPYHAWTFATDGTLRGLPNKEGFPSVDTQNATHSLQPLWAGEIGGFIFVQARGVPQFDLEQWAGQLAGDLRYLGIDQYHVFAPGTRSWDINWKLPLDIFLENYHTKFTHTTTIYPVFQQNTGTFDSLGPHIRCVLPKRSIVGLRELPPDQWSLIDHATILYTIFPNTMVAALPHHVAVWHIYPTGVDSCSADFYTLISERASTDKAQAEWQKSLHVVTSVESEDTARAVSIQQECAVIDAL